MSQAYELGFTDAFSGLGFEAPRERSGHDETDYERGFAHGEIARWNMLDNDKEIL